MYGQHHIIIVGSDEDLRPSVVAHSNRLALARTANLIARYHVAVRTRWQASLKRKK